MSRDDPAPTTGGNVVGLLVGCCLLLAACSCRPAEPAIRTPPAADPGEPGDVGGVEGTPQDPFRGQRASMIQEQLMARDIVDPEVLRAMERVHRHRFVPEEFRHLSYADRPLPIGHAQTISQPYIVALMTQLVKAGGAKRALDVGTGSGYQAAVLGELVDHVYGIEILCPLADRSRALLNTLGYENVTVRCGDGYGGWTEHAPFDVIIVAAAPEEIPQALIDQLAPGGRLVIPVGTGRQDLTLVVRGEDGAVNRTSVLPVRFVPMTGEALDR